MNRAQEMAGQLGQGAMFQYQPYLLTEAELKHELEQERLKVQAQLMEEAGSG